MTEQYEVAGDVDSWCTKCRMMLTHTIVAMVDRKPKRVHCNTCHGEHIWRPHPPGWKPPRKVRTPARRGSAAPKPRKTNKTNEYFERIKNRDPRGARRYRIQENWTVDELIDHPSFGLGVVTAVVVGGKVKVLFEVGEKLLVQGR